MKLKQLLIIFFILLISCGGSPNESRNRTKPVKTNNKTVAKNKQEKNNKEKNNEKARKKEKKHKKKKLEFKEIFTYKNLNKRDPFELPDTSEFETLTEKTKGADFDFSKYKYKGLLDLGEKMAIIEDSTGKGFILKEGDNFGGALVKNISNEKIILKKSYVESTGSKKEIILEKVQPEGGK